jgi:hypothetical protein
MHLQNGFSYLLVLPFACSLKSPLQDHRNRVTHSPPILAAVAPSTFFSVSSSVFYCSFLFLDLPCRNSARRLVSPHRNLVDGGARARSGSTRLNIVQDVLAGCGGGKSSPSLSAPFFFRVLNFFTVVGTHLSYHSRLTSDHIGFDGPADGPAVSSSAMHKICPPSSAGRIPP